MNFPGKLGLLEAAIKKNDTASHVVCRDHGGIAAPDRKSPHISKPHTTPKE
jgi:hypothetical protein